MFWVAVIRDSRTEFVQRWFASEMGLAYYWLVPSGVVLATFAKVPLASAMPRACVVIFNGHCHGIVTQLMVCQTPLSSSRRRGCQTPLSMHAPASGAQCHNQHYAAALSTEGARHLSIDFRRCLGWMHFVPEDS